MSVTIEEPTTEERTETGPSLADVLTRAADLLEEFDWQQGSDGSCAEGSMCLVGALRETGIGGMKMVEAVRALNLPGHAVPWQWNDMPDRTKAEVVATLRRAAERAA